MNAFEIIVPTLFGVEAVTANEIRRLGYDVTKTADGRVTFLGDYDAVCESNINLRTGERVLIKIAEFKAETFDELFENTKNADWKRWLNKNCAFPVTGFSIKSKLHSVPACQSVIKKSIVTAMTELFGINTLPETGETRRIEFSIIKDVVTIMLDTTGEPLHKRGYRIKHNAAPIKETLAAAIAILSRFNYNTVMADPFCGSGTFPIECAMIAKNIAPGLNRRFSAMEFKEIDKKCWNNAFLEAKENIREDTRLTILASDIDKAAISLTRENAKNAGVSDMITAAHLPISEFKCDISGGTIICNPPYGERLLEQKACERIYTVMGDVYRSLDNWGLFALTPSENFENLFAITAAKKRKLYNGMIKCCLYEYFPKRQKNL